MLIISGYKRGGRAYCRGRGRTYSRGKEETGKKIKKRAQEEGEAADERSWNPHKKGGAQKAIRM